jgi:hypothetical protein
MITRGYIHHKSKMDDGCWVKHRMNLGMIKQEYHAIPFNHCDG